MPLTEAALAKALEDVWKHHNPPEYMVIDARTGERFRIVSEEAQRLREVCTPVGLRRLFPALR